VLTDEQTGGMKLSWSDPEMLTEVIRRIAYREGLGDILADGTRRASEKYGGKEYAIHVKGLECPMHDPRALWGMSLTYATSIRGACHCADANLYADMGLITHDELGIKRSWPFKAKGKAAQTVGSQVKSVLSNSAVICEYVMVSAFGGVGTMAGLLNPVTGFGYDVNSLRDTADRIWYIKRAIGNLCGATREHDQLPQRILEPHPEGVNSNLTTALFPTYITMKPMGKLRNSKMHEVSANLATKYLFPNIDRLLRGMRFLPGLSGHERRLKRGDLSEKQRSTVPFREMLEEFYRLRDIDEQGRPSRSRLESLGMKEVADALHG
jgi:aldehyde:ferredoxin oxidoreductase